VVREPAAGTRAPKSAPRSRPADITRPQLILDDTVVDMAGLRGDRPLSGFDLDGNAVTCGFVVRDC
jgi:hypothetical protein